MGKIDHDKRRLTGAILSRSFTLANPPLSPIENIALECLRQIASDGRVAARRDVEEAIGTTNLAGSTATHVVNRLVAKGYVEHVTGAPLQRAIWVRIIATGQCTAEPNCKTTHWRYRSEAVPAPAIHHVRQRSKSLAQMIEAKAASLGKPMQEFLMDCVYAGFHAINAEGEAA